MTSRVIALALASVIGVDAGLCITDNKAMMEACVPGCVEDADKSGCLEQCLTGRGVSRGCATELSTGFSCAVSQCPAVCEDATSSGCADCLRSKCSPKTRSAEPSELLAPLVFHRKNGTEPLESEAKSTGCYENKPALKSCGTRCFSKPNKFQCAYDCLKAFMSRSCARCFGHKVQCTIAKCLGKCAGNSESYACTSCVRSKCGRCDMEKSAAGAAEDDEEFFKAVASFAADASDETEKTMYP